MKQHYLPTLPHIKCEQPFAPIRAARIPLRREQALYPSPVTVAKVPVVDPVDEEGVRVGIGGQVAVAQRGEEPGVNRAILQARETVN